MIDKETALFDYASSLTELSPSGGRLFGCCPIHQEKTASFVVNGEKWKCYGACGTGGDVFDLWQAVNGGGYIDAKKALGFWEESGHRQPVKRKPPPKKRVATNGGRVFKCIDKKLGYTEAIRSLRGGYQLEISYYGTVYWNFDFYASCLLHMNDRVDWLAKLIVTCEKGPYRSFLVDRVEKFWRESDLV